MEAAERKAEKTYSKKGLVRPEAGLLADIRKGRSDRHICTGAGRLWHREAGRPQNEEDCQAYRKQACKRQCCRALRGRTTSFLPSYFVARLALYKERQQEKGGRAFAKMHRIIHGALSDCRAFRSAI